MGIVKEIDLVAECLTLGSNIRNYPSLLKRIQGQNSGHLVIDPQNTQGVYTNLKHDLCRFVCVCLCHLNRLIAEINY